MMVSMAMAVFPVCRSPMIDGESVEDVLDYVNFSDKALVRIMENWVSTSVKEGKISLQEGKEFLNIYRSGLYGYTYLEE